ncbi:MAG: hypothetical protein NC417_04695, partial [Candidatus Gastranaerophilales bacterium]|nr:hypothetical protein [Candidatus Gastranaerophilales bacterium]
LSTDGSLASALEYIIRTIRIAASGEKIGKVSCGKLRSSGVIIPIRTRFHSVKHVAAHKLTKYVS